MIDEYLFFVTKQRLSFWTYVGRPSRRKDLPGSNMSAASNEVNKTSHFLNSHFMTSISCILELSSEYFGLSLVSQASSHDISIGSCLLKYVATIFATSSIRRRPYHNRKYIAFGKGDMTNRCRGMRNELDTSVFR